MGVAQNDTKQIPNVREPPSVSSIFLSWKVSGALSSLVVVRSREGSGEFQNLSLLLGVVFIERHPLGCMCETAVLVRRCASIASGGAGELDAAHALGGAMS